MGQGPEHSVFTAPFAKPQDRSTDNTWSRIAAETHGAIGEVIGGHGSIFAIESERIQNTCKDFLPFVTIGAESSRGRIQGNLDVVNNHFSENTRNQVDGLFETALNGGNVEWQHMNNLNRRV